MDESHAYQQVFPRVNPSLYNKGWLELKQKLEFYMSEVSNWLPGWPYWMKEITKRREPRGPKIYRILQTLS